MRLYLSSFRLGNRPQELLRLLGDARRTAVIVNAEDYKQPEDRAAYLARELAELEGVGLEPTEVDLRRYFDAPSKLRHVLSGFDCLWVRGGNAFILRRAFRQSGADELVAELLDDDAVVYGGYSAGPDMLSPSLRGVELVDDPQVIPDGYDPEVVWDCLGVVPYAIAPHYRSDHPESPAIDQYVQYLIDNHLFFIALRDGQAIVRGGTDDMVVD